MRILITGGAGFVGFNLAIYFREYGHDVIVMDNLVRRGTELNMSRFKECQIKFVHGDVRNKEDFVQLPKVDFILETSAQPSVIDGYNNPMFDMTNNTIGLLNCLEFARKNDAGLIFWSTNKVYSGDRINVVPRVEEETRWVWPKDVGIHKYTKGFDSAYGFSDSFDIDGGEHSIYGLSKVCADLACQEWYQAFGVPTVVNRFSCLAGPRQWGKSAQGWVTWFAIAMALDLPLCYIGWRGKQVRDVLFIDDICRLVDLEIKQINSIKGSVYNVGGGKDNTLSLREAVDLLIKHYPDYMSNVKEIEEPRKGDHVIYISDIRKVSKALGWEPKVGIEEGYQQIVKWVEDNKEALKEMYL